MKKLILSAASLMLLTSVFPAHAIKKCQDADGKWHYGDIAVGECQRSKVTTLGKRGFIENERAAPKTEQQIQKEKDELAVIEAEAAKIKAEEDERNRILSIYESESDIDRQRDNQIQSVEGNIAVHKAYLKSLEAKVERLEKKGAEYKSVRKERNLAAIADANSRIEKSSAELIKLSDQKKAIMERFDNEKRIYREIKSQI